MIPRLFHIPYGCGKYSIRCGTSGGMRANFRGVCEKVREISNNI
ncbi:MAG TPA: hypothetical protein VE244_09535 [Nitrososphaeraceae archaeon]|nr:hypothetical protein [Nitrososphaeraceae archaeon]